VGYDISYDHLVGWEADLHLLTERVADSLFTRPEPRATFADLVRGLMADVPRKNSWQLAEHVGHGSAYRLEWLLGGAKWDAEVLRDRVRDYVVATLGAEDGVLIADDTQVIKKGVKSVGVAPQHCGLTRQNENCQVMPMLSYASAGGHAFIDRALYLPRRWTDDPQRCAQAGVPAEREFATKPQLVIDMLDRALAAAVPFRYFTADSGYGRDPALRARCHAAAVAYAWPTCWPSRSICRWRAGGGRHPPRSGAGLGAESGVGAPLLRAGHQGRPLLRLGRGRGHRQGPAARRRARPHAADPPLGGRPQRGRVLPRPRGIDHILHWSLFRRLHQTRALISHYRRRGDPLLAELRM